MLDSAVREKLLTILRPIYQDLDGISRQGDIERVSRIAHALTQPTRALELLLLLYPAAKWLEKAGNLSRVSLASGVSEEELRGLSASMRRLDLPHSDEERAIASALLIDRSGVRGLAETFSRARREGRSVAEISREILEENTIPEWMSDEAAAMLEERLKVRRSFCEALLRES
ncbi:MAG: hypothetical protein ACXVJT_18235 [Thermoanaerobaculia bacterium]